DKTHTTIRVLATGRSWFDPAVSPVRLAAEARDPGHLELLRALGFRGEMVVPLVAREHTLGTITLVAADEGRTYDHDDLALAEELARRCALAIDNARLYDAERRAHRAAERLVALTRDLGRDLAPEAVLDQVADA